MDFRELQFITAIARHQNITKAAEALYITQPALSKFLASLENELGLKLFDRVDRKYIPTYAGGRYLEYARTILDTKASLDSELADIIACVLIICANEPTIDIEAALQKCFEKNLARAEGRGDKK